MHPREVLYEYASATPHPRELLLGEPECARPTISRDGNRLAWLAPDEHGVLQIGIRELAAGMSNILMKETARSFICRVGFTGTHDLRSFLHTISVGDANQFLKRGFMSAAQLSGK